MAMTAAERDLRRTLLGCLADGRPRTHGELMRCCGVGRPSFEAQRRKLAHHGLLARVNEGLALTPIGRLHLLRTLRLADDV